MKYYLIAGERSGDLHGSHVMAELLKQDDKADFRFFGGDKMQKIGGHLSKHYSEMAFMGFLEVAANFDKVIKNFSDCKKDILDYKPDVLFLIDYSGFNLRMAKFAKKNNIKVFYYISPKVWAWNQSRAWKIKELVDKMFVIFPFEQEFYKKYGFDVDFVGNPLMDTVIDFVPNPNFRKQNNLSDKPIIAILPGSRKSEVEFMLHYMISILPSFSDYLFVVAAVSNLDKKYYEAFARAGRVEIVYNQSYDILSLASAAIVTSGTATLETALFKVPQVVCYATSDITYLIAKMVVKINYISLPNIVSNKLIVKELIQSDFTPANVITELDKLLNDPIYRSEMLDNYNELESLLGQKGASRKTAELTVKYLGL